MRLLIIGLILCSFLGACAGGNFNGQEAELVLPNVIEYSRDVQNKAADELENNNVPTLAEFMKDYKVMRDQTRSAIDSGWLGF